jgi:zinc transport system substrate-binding protein
MRWALVAAGVVALLMAACADRSEAARVGAAGPLRVLVTIPPLCGLAKAVAPEGAEVRSLLPPGRSEHGYEFSPSDVAALGRADVVVYVGLGLEPRVEAFLADHPSVRRQVVCFGDVAGLAQPGGGHGAELHTGGEHDEHDHGPIDPHLWLDASLVTKLVPAVETAMVAAMESAGASAAEREAVRTRAARLVERVRGADERWRAAVAPLAGRAIVTHHAAWGRLAGRYGLTVAAVIRPIETQEPTPGQIAAAVEAIRTQGVKGVFVEPQFSAAAAERIAAGAGVTVGTLDPIGSEDWFALMDRNVAELVRVLRP